MRVDSSRTTQIICLDCSVMIKIERSNKSSGMLKFQYSLNDTSPGRRLGQWMMTPLYCLAFGLNGINCAGQILERSFNGINCLLVNWMLVVIFLTKSNSRSKQNFSRPNSQHSSLI